VCQEGSVIAWARFACSVWLGQKEGGGESKSDKKKGFLRVAGNKKKRESSLRLWAKRYVASWLLICIL